MTHLAPSDRPPRRAAMTSLARHALVWLSLALAACGGSSTRSVSDGEAGEKATGGIAGTGTGGRGGTDAGPSGGFSFDGGTGGIGGTPGTAGTAGAPNAYPTMSGFELTVNGVRVFYENTALAFELTCGRQTTLVKASGEPWFDARPPCNQPYYIDGIYEENVETFQCFGCDYQTCALFPGSHTFATIDYVQVGTRPAPDDGFGGQGGEGGVGTPTLIPDIQSRVYRGALTFTIRYYTDAFCSEALQTQPPVTFSLGAGSDGASGAGN